MEDQAETENHADRAMDKEDNDSDSDSGSSDTNSDSVHSTDEAPELLGTKTKVEALPQSSADIPLPLRQVSAKLDDEKNVCTNFSRTGRCKFGKRCRYKHVVSVITSESGCALSDGPCLASG